MRKFNLKGKVVQKMMGMDDTSVSGKTKKQTKAPAQEPDRIQDTNRSGEDTKPIAPEGLVLAWRTDVGRMRKNNQDAVILGYGLIGVADGMGGHNGGEIASAGLRDGLLRELKDQKPDSEQLKTAVQKINLELWEQQEKDASLTGMGTTLTILWAGDSEMIIAQVGDSRAYLLRNGEMKQITNDHSMVADMVRKGVLTEEQAACHPMRNYITRAVGTEDTIEVDIQTIPRMKGDRWLVCSDGLYGQIGKKELELLMAGDPEKAADKLLQEALENGGRDNISFVLIQDDREQEKKEEREDQSTCKSEETEKCRNEEDNDTGERGMEENGLKTHTSEEEAVQ